MARKAHHCDRCGRHRPAGGTVVRKTGRRVDYCAKCLKEYRAKQGRGK